MKIIEISKSFGFKKNLGNYQMADFFTSVKAEVTEEELAEAGKKLQQIAQNQVGQDVKKYSAAMEKISEDPKEPAQPKAKMTYQDLADKKGWDTPGTVDMHVGVGDPPKGAGAEGYEWINN